MIHLRREEESGSEDRENLSGYVRMLYIIPLVKLQEGTKRNVLFFGNYRISDVINVLAFDIEIVFTKISEKKVVSCFSQFYEV